MKKRTFILLLVIGCTLNVSADDRYFSEMWISIFNGYREVISQNVPNDQQLDFLNYVFTKSEKSDYNYFDIATRLRHNDRYVIDASLSLYNSLVPYEYNVSFNYLFPNNFGIIAGSMLNRYYLVEFNDFYANTSDKDIVTRYINREWKFNMMSYYVGPTYQTRFNTIELCAALKTGLTTFLPFNQRNIIKEIGSNYKKVYDYQANVHLAPFVMPEILINIDLLKYKKIILGGRLKISYLLTRNSINYQLNTYEWDYESKVTEKVNLPQHNFQQTEWDFGFYFRW